MAPNQVMSSARLEAFSDGVIAIIITIMVLELHAPEESDPRALLDLWPVFLSYVLSFMMVAIYWMNHHYMFHGVKYVNNRILWSNILLLFCLSLIPFATAYMGEHNISGFSVALEAFVLFLCGAFYFVLYYSIRSQFSENNQFQSIDSGSMRKNIVALIIYFVAIGISFFNAAVAFALLFVVAVMYIAPGRRADPTVSVS